MSTTSTATLRLLFSHKPFLLYFAARGFSEFGTTIGVVAVGWQVYVLTDSAFDLGLVGMVQFIPTAFLTFVAGHAADRYERNSIVKICQLVEAVAAAALAWGTLAGWLTVREIFAAVAVFGAASAFESPAASALRSHRFRRARRLPPRHRR